MAQHLRSLYQQFCDKSLPKSEWTHEAHLWVAAICILEKGAPEALDFLRIHIPQYNIATGGENTETAGYHETLTCFYVEQVSQYLKNHHILSLEDLVASNLVHSEIADRAYPLRFYDKEVLFSIEARLHYVAPTQ